MGKPTGFLEIERAQHVRRPPEERAVLFGSATHLRGRVLEEMAIVERNLAALDAAARKAAGLDQDNIR